MNRLKIVINRTPTQESGAIVQRYSIERCTYKFTGNHVFQSLFNKVASLNPANLLKIDSCTCVNFCEIFKNTYFENYPGVAVDNDVMIQQLK